MEYEKGKIPKLYETENIPMEEKIIYQKWHLKLRDSRYFFWLIAELDPVERIAFGYANLDDDQNAEWGYADLTEILLNGGERDMRWKPLKFDEALKKVLNEREEYHRKMKEKYGLL